MLPLFYFYHLVVNKDEYIVKQATVAFDESPIQEINHCDDVTVCQAPLHLDVLKILRFWIFHKSKKVWGLCSVHGTKM